MNPDDQMMLHNEEGGERESRIEGKAYKQDGKLEGVIMFQEFSNSMKEELRRCRQVGQGLITYIFVDLAWILDHIVRSTGKVLLQRLALSEIPLQKSPAVWRMDKCEDKINDKGDNEFI